MKKLGMLLLFFVVIIAGCGTSEEQPEATQPETGTSPSNETNPIVTIVMENNEEIKIELFPEVAPNTVNNFISLVEEGYYDGLIFHRVIPGFVIQGGDPLGNGTGGPGYSIPGEFTANGFENNLSHEPGVISMARSRHFDSAGSQFFIVVGNATSLDGEYAGFGKVIDGMDTVNAIVQEEAVNERPQKDQVMQMVTVETHGIDYDEPAIID
ncbi:peptidylprolyl isomerase [Bacillus alkalicellulosilyticus]|uniref:peptidylprolyl isomerase n=1 Tax=Alkalihalobacterium alkalicellulosilyticum TaxID=1912214 RepID=UPI0009974534|nr:peptidylprolyl isomerase [Bacillus alkalicellulosilyticus]